MKGVTPEVGDLNTDSKHLFESPRATVGAMTVKPIVMSASVPNMLAITDKIGRN